ncbi:hypothetical protein P344_03495 [Spiroplasma mirum ATCC 29335]|uniref:Uncharacterized protein n=1 Tax=Spiroplasma mirum ATCC 29335 TaxID=838561 RepID=W0GL81_9MOLU|nr:MULTISPECIES: hypothetical protein [Spiroplasma]AHF61015.1 hypothetical protein SMM_0590 [Spiroplasma mirum ATCC 29335]AHI58041.1 hypothetical protein P344_03495 [Spiroplasma mirum ATCC 29335]AKM53120.1 hypothetical protein SATRI_v1c06480 [Spiroplasma atrichopogonis]
MFQLSYKKDRKLFPCETITKNIIVGETILSVNLKSLDYCEYFKEKYGAENIFIVNKEKQQVFKWWDIEKEVKKWKLN